MEQLSETAQRILAELEEAWTKNIYTLINTVFEPKGGFGEVDQFQSAAGELFARDFIAIGTETFYPRNPQELTRADAMTLLNGRADLFRFDAAERLWNLSQGTFKDARIPVVYLTDAGLREARASLDRRGY